MAPSVLFVGDHTDQPNVGGRSQSLALADLLRKRFAISDFVPGRVVNGNARYIRTILPSSLVRSLIYRRAEVRWADCIVKAEEKLGAGDFITDDPGTSAENILKYSKKYSDIDNLRRQVESADIVVINGEGSGVFSTPPRRDFSFNLAMAELGLRLGKAVFVVDTILSDCPLTGRNDASIAAAADVLGRCTGVHVRDLQSLEYARDHMPYVRCRYVPDALFTWYDLIQDPAFKPPQCGDFSIPFPEDRRWLGRVDFSSPYVCVAGSSLCAYEPERAIPRFRRLVEKLHSRGLPVLLMQTCGGDAFLEQVAAETGTAFVPVQCPVYLAASIISHAHVFVSGRFHPSILAGLGGVPSVFLAAHSHKIHSLVESLGYSDEPIHSAFPTDDEVGLIVERVGSLWAREGAPSELRKALRATARQCATAASETVNLIHEASVS